MISMVRSACSSSTSATAGDSRTLQSCGAGLSPSPMNSSSIALLLAATGRGTAAPAACNMLSMANSWCSQPPNSTQRPNLLLFSDSAHSPRLAENPALLIDGGVLKIAVPPRPIGLQGEISFAAPRAGPAAIDGCLLAALHRKEHLFDPTVLEKRPNLVDDLCAHARALHLVRGSPRGACRGGR